MTVLRQGSRCVPHLLCLLVLLLPGALSAAHDIPAKVLRVADGDTLTVLTANQTTLRLRLLGIDAPELPHGQGPGQPFAKETLMGA